MNSILMTQNNLDSIETLAITSNNQYAVSGGRDGTINTWNLLSKTNEQKLTNAHTGNPKMINLIFRMD
mgnify:CR=1 FL=1